MHINRFPFGAAATAIALVTAAVVFVALSGVAIAQTTGQTSDSSGGATARASAGEGSVIAQPIGSAAKAPSHGLDLAINLRASTLGLGGEISKLIGGHLGVRVGANVLNYNMQPTLQGTAYKARFDFKNFTALGDLFPFDHGSFHFTGGYVSANDNVNGTAAPGSSGTITLNGTEYTSAQAGVVTETLSFPKSGGYAGIGWGSPSSRGGRVRMLFDLGAVIGTPTFDLHATNEQSDPQLAADVAAQRDNTRTKLSTYWKVWPVVSLGLGVHF